MACEYSVKIMWRNAMKFWQKDIFLNRQWSCGTCKKMKSKSNLNVNSGMYMMAASLLRVLTAALVACHLPSLVTIATDEGCTDMTRRIGFATDTDLMGSSICCDVTNPHQIQFLCHINLKLNSVSAITHFYLFSHFKFQFPVKEQLQVSIMLQIN